METQLFTSGYLAQKFQLPVRAIESELDEAGYRPVLCINDLPHWGIDCIVHLRRVSRRLALGSKGDE